MARRTLAWWSVAPALALGACVVSGGPAAKPTPVGRGAPGSGVAGAAAAGARQEQAEAGGVLIHEVPFQQWAPLPGRQVGLLVSASSPWGGQIGWTRGLPDPRQAGAEGRVYWFLSDGHSPQVLYFESRGEGKNFLKNWSVPLADGGAGTYDAAMFGPATPNRFGLSGDAHLVELEVNGGRGAAAGIHFVATDVRVLDGDGDHGIVPAQALTLARQGFERFVVDRRDAMEASLAASKKQAGPAVGEEHTGVQEGLFPTWRNDSGELRVLFVRQVRRQSQRTTMQMRAYPCKKYQNRLPPGPGGVVQMPGGTLRPCPAPHEEPVTITVGYGVEVAQEYVFDRQGALVEVVSYEPGALPIQRSNPQGLGEDY